MKTAARVLCTIGMLAVALWRVEAAAADDPAAAVSEPRRGPSDPAELAAFVDGVMTAQMKDKHVAGAVFIMVIDNKPFFAKGYGLADVEAGKPVDPETTMFRIASVSKLFTWTALMQLAEQGKLDLDADINQYLADFKIPATYPEPITCKHLLSHTPGFEDRVIGLFGRGPSDEPLGKLLSHDLPARVRPPGQLASYSNHGTALAGYIVSQVSGMPWEDYIEQHLLTPLEMHHTSVRQPPEDQLPADLSKGYKYARARFEKQSFEYIPAAPAGCISSSAGDMAKFMIAHLQDGEYGSSRILGEDSARTMRSLLFAHEPSLPGMGYGFMRMTYNGEEIVHHGGDTFYFHSFLVLLPERHAGFFVSYNTDTSGEGLREKLCEALLDRYYPAADPPQAVPVGKVEDSLARYAGTYGSLRHSYTSIAKLAALVAVATVSVDGDELLVQGAGTMRRFAPTAPLMFREIDGQNALVFRADPNGHVTHLFSATGGAGALERLRWFNTPRFNLSLLAVCVAVFLSALLGWPVVAFVTREVRRQDTAPRAGARRATLLGWFTCGLILALIVAAGLVLSSKEDIAFGVPPKVKALVWLTPLVAALSAGVAVSAIVAWRQRYWRFSGRLHYTCVASACIAFLWFLNHWNLLSFGA